MIDPVETLLEQVLRTTAGEDMLREGETVLAAVSGGPDSVCMLDALLAMNQAVEVGHLDHMTRDGQSSADAAFVRKLAQSRGLPCHIEQRPVAHESRDSGQSFEEYAREARYAFLLDAARKAGCAAVATGHNADDVAETVLMRVLRGASPSGLGGIPPVRIARGLRIIRPLIACTREQILAYLEARRIAYRTDASNLEVDYFRNRVRLRLLPQLTREYNPRLREALCRLAEVQRVETDLLEALADAVLAECVHGENLISRDKFRAAHRALQRRAVAKLAQRHGVDCSFERINEGAAFIAEGNVGHVFDLGGGIQLRNGRNDTQIFAAEAESLESPSPLLVPGETYALGKRFRVRILPQPPGAPLAGYCTPRRQVFDARKATRNLMVRRWREGDRFQPLGMEGTRKLQDYFVDRGVPSWERRQIPLVCREDAILWVVAHAVSADAALDDATRETLEIEVDDAPE